jgi:hypothetical protein
VHGVHTTNPQATHAAERPWFGGLVGLRAGGSGARNRARANRYSQEERVTSQHGPYAECYAMSNAIWSFLSAAGTVWRLRRANSWAISFGRNTKST